MLLSLRLNAIASLVDSGEVAIDIGSDHGLLPRFLLFSNQVKKMYATDYGEAPYLSLKNHLADTDVITYQANGLERLPLDITTVIITGIGGALIAHMLEAKVLVQRHPTLILGPHRDAHLVRKTLQAQGYTITEEKLVNDHQHLYQLIKAKPGVMTLSVFEAYYGPLLAQARTPLWITMLTKEKINLLKKIKTKDNEDVVMRLQGIQHYVKN